MVGSVWISGEAGILNVGLETRCQFTARVSFLSRKGSGSSRMGLVKGGGGPRATASLLIGSCLSPCFLSLRITIITPMPLAIRIHFPTRRPRNGTFKATSGPAQHQREELG